MQYGKAGLVGHCARLGETTAISRERIGILPPARAEEPARILKYSDALSGRNERFCRLPGRGGKG